jgi:hypothetical protein
MKTSVWMRGIAASMISALALLATAWADPPGRVARLAEYAGEVQIASAQEPWQPAYRNLVVTAGDNLWVSDDGRAELDVGPIQVWLAGGSNVYFEQFDDHSVIARLATGVLAVRIRQWEPKDALRIATPHGEVSFVRPGLYLVSAGDGHSPSTTTTRFGQSELTINGRVQWVSSGESFSFDRSGARFDRFAYGGNAWGVFESWVTARDRRIDRWEQRNRGRDINPWIIGVRDLDDHGYWDTHYEYGRVWYPRNVSYDWAPYRYGRWSWVQPWGWTWVDDAPWGFAPFHYGRWVRVGGRWAWCPGSYVGRAVYAPALVTFFGGSNWRVSVSTGPSYAWVPLGWNEPYVPWYTYTPTYWRQVNRPYVRNSAEDPWRPPGYVHARVPGAVTAVAAGALVPGRPVAQYALRNIAESDLRSAPPARMGEVVPQVATRRGFDPNPVAGNPTAQPSYSTNAPPPIQRSSPPPAMVREQAPQVVQPNTNVIEPRIWEDPNPIALRAIREAAPRAMREPAPSAPRQSAPRTIRESAPTYRDREQSERAPVRIRESSVQESAPQVREETRGRGDERRAERAMPQERERRRSEAQPDRAESERTAPVQRGKDKAPAPRES